MNFKSISIQAFRIALTVVIMLGFIGMPQNAVRADDLVHIVAYPLEERVQALGWPMNETVTLAINDPPDFTSNLTVSGYADWDSSMTIADFQFSGSYDLKPGDSITITGASATANYVVVGMEIASANPDADMVYGTAPINSYVDVTVWIDTGAASSRHVLTDGSGNWSANFSELGENGELTYNIQGGEWIGAQQWNEQGNGTAIAWQVPNPRFDVRANTDRVEGWEWTIGETVTLNIDDPGTPDSPDYTDTQAAFIPEDWDTTLVEFDLTGTDYDDIKPGDVVTLSNGTITKTTTVTDLAITNINVETDVVSGVALPGSHIDLWASNPPDWHNVNRHVTADEDGNWSADFSVIVGTGDDEQETSDIIGDTWIDSQQPELDEGNDGDKTMFGQNVPRFAVFPEWHWFDGYSWPDGAQVVITVAGKPECAVTKESWDGFFNGNFGEGCNIITGDVVTFTDGVTSLTHTVKNLAITEVNADMNTVTGTADEGETVYVWPHETGQQIQTIAENGIWQADFTGTFDIEPNDCGLSEIRDDMGLATAVDWCAPNPRIETHPQWNEVYARGWPKGTDLTLTISGHEGEFYATMDQAPWNEDDPNDIVAVFPLNGFDLLPGQELTIIGGGLSRIYTIPNPQITNIDIETETITGIATPGARVQVCAQIPDSCISRNTTANDSGNWTVEFLTFTDPSDTPEPFNLELGSNGWMYESDDDGDQTWGDDWRVPNPRLTASITDDWFRAEEFPPNATLDINIYKSMGGDLYWHDTRSTDGNGFAFWASWETGMDLDLKPGMHLVVTIGDVTKDIVLEPLLLFTLETDTDVLAGSAPPNRDMWIGTGNDNSWCSMNVTSESDGAWSADFASQDPGCDVTPDMWAAAQIFDPDGDATEANPGFPRGSHDYDGGDTASSSCKAGGWTFDPDDQSRPVQVRILSDGDVVSELTANVDGSRGYEVDLWGVISSYAGHEIKVEAYDEESDAWYTLENSPRDLTCRTYDIYTYDPLTGTTKQISSLRETDEYNPSWSPNGRVIAHDVVTPNSHEIYLTQVATGKSTPLKGANGGNDAAWSPNGLWIAFDRRWVGDESLYVVPFAGGQRRLVREHAVSAGWSPNGLRIAFQDLADSGKLKTVGLLGQVVITVADFGDNPAWSPDGKWIAYQRDGDIWKVRVGQLGTPLGAPILVVDMGTDVGSPTWSADGTTIVFGYGPGGDWDLWSVSAAGGEPAWLTGAPAVGDYDPEYARSGSSIAYESVSPDGQAQRNWVAAFTGDLPAGSWSEGEHSYYFHWVDGLIDVPYDSESYELNVSSGATLYDGNVLLRWGTFVANDAGNCLNIDAINPMQATRFHIGWTPEGSYADARAYFDNVTAQAVWDGVNTLDLELHEVFPFTSWENWFAYTCTFTAP